MNERKVKELFEKIFNYMGITVLYDRRFSVSSYLSLADSDTRKKNINKFLDKYFENKTKSDNMMTNMIEELQKNTKIELKDRESFFKFFDEVYPKQKEGERVVPEPSSPVSARSDVEDTREKADKERKKGDTVDYQKFKNKKNLKEGLKIIRNLALAYIPLLIANSLGGYLGFPASVMAVNSFTFGLPLMIVSGYYVVKGARYLIKSGKLKKMFQKLKGIRKSKSQEEVNVETKENELNHDLLDAMASKFASLSSGTAEDDLFMEYGNPDDYHSMDPSDLGLDGVVPDSDGETPVSEPDEISHGEEIPVASYETKGTRYFGEVHELRYEENLEKKIQELERKEQEYLSRNNFKLASEYASLIHEFKNYLEIKKEEREISRLINSETTANRQELLRQYEYLKIARDVYKNKLRDDMQKFDSRISK